MSLCAAAPSLTRAGAVRSVGTKGLVAVRPCRRTVVKVQALMSPENKEKEKRTFITREEEPEEYWSSKSEKSGDVFKDPIALGGIVAILFPFVFVLIAIATGAIDTSVYR